jgi:dihydrolipoamide dehydrogenase
MKKVSVAIIGAGSAGLSALRQVNQQTGSFVIIDQTPLGTKCARTGCMPSKALIIAAGDYHRRSVLMQEGIRGGHELSPDIPAVLRFVRAMRDGFTEKMVEATRQRAGDKLIIGKARIIAPDCIQVNQMQIRADRIILATGSVPVVPDAWRAFGDRILTSETLFEQTDLPRRIGVIGLGPIGLEIGQALSRLGLDIAAFGRSSAIGGLTDPAVNETAAQIIGGELPLYRDAPVEVQASGDQLNISYPDGTQTVDAVLAAMGVAPHLNGLGLENLGLTLDERGLPPFDRQTMQIADLPLFIAGDVNGVRPILHEALDEGMVAGQNSVSSTVRSYCRRTPLHVVFTDPQIAVAGQNYERLKEDGQEFVIGKADFRQQSRAALEQRGHGLLHVYADSRSGCILSAELVCPGAEHLAHQLAVAVQHQLTVFDMLRTPFYHPTIEEALRTAFQDAAGKITGQTQPPDITLSLCQSCPEPPLR